MENFDEKPLKIGIKGSDLDRISISMYSTIFSCENKKRNIDFF